jgi:hypothetical protein
MKHDPHAPDFNDATTAAEWAAQERALADERLGRDPQAADAASRGYRRIAHLLAQPLDEQLPPDFARQVARQVERAPTVRAVDARLERNLLALLAVAMIGAMVLYGSDWLPSLEQGTTGVLLTRPWVWALAACLGLSRLCDRWFLRTPTT